MIRKSQKHFIEGMKYALAPDAQKTPPVPCEFAVGDVVTFTNDNGVVFPGRVITGFSPTIEWGRFIYFDSSSWWFPVSPKNLMKEGQRVELIEKDAPLSDLPLHVADIRSFDPKAVYIANQLGSEKESDYVAISGWIKSNNYSDWNSDTLVELFDREVGLQAEGSSHPQRPPMKP